MQGIWKRKGEKATATNSRCILVQSHLGKLHGATLQNELAEAYPNAVAGTQCRAVKGRGASTAGLVAELHGDVARRLGHSFSRLYVESHCSVRYSMSRTCYGVLVGRRYIDYRQTSWHGLPRRGLRAGRTCSLPRTRIFWSKQDCHCLCPNSSTTSIGIRGWWSRQASSMGALKWCVQSVAPDKDARLVP